MLNDPIRGAAALIKGLKLISQPSLRRFVYIPLLVNVAIFSLLIWLGITQFEILLEKILPHGTWWDSLRWLAWPLFMITVVLLVFYCFTVLANLIAAPFNSLLAEKVEDFLSGQQPNQQMPSLQLLNDVAPTVWSEIRKILYFLLRAVPLLILFLIPGINVVAALLWALFSAWYLALEYADYPLGNRGIRFSQQQKLLKKHRLTALGFGGALTLMMMVPILNFFAMPAATAGATALWRDRD